MPNPFDQFDAPAAAPSQSAPRKPNPFDQFDTATSTTADVAKSFGSGIVKGAVGVATLPHTLATAGYNGAQWLAKKMGIEGPDVGDTFDFLPSYEGTKAAVEDKVTGPLHEPQTLPGHYAQTAGEFLPNAVAPGGVVTRVANVVTPAVVSESAGQLTKGTAAEPWARIIGGLVGGAGAQRVATPFPVNAERARQVAVLDAEGIGGNLTAGQRTGSEALRYLESAASTVPGGGGRAVRMQQAAGEDFTRAALRRVGENAPRATDEVIDRAFTRIGGEFDRLAANNTLVPDQRMVHDLRAAVADYHNLVQPNARAPIVENTINDIAQGLQANGGQLPGEVYQALRSRLDRAARQSRTDPQLQDALFNLRNTIDDAMARGMSQADQASWREARTQYRNMMVIEKAANRAGEASAEGIITPAALASATKQQNFRDYARGRGDYGELARAGAAVMQPLPNSGTAQRANAQGMLAAGGAAVGAAAGGPAGAAAGTLAPLVSQIAGSRMLMSPPVQAWLANQAAANGARAPIWMHAPQLGINALAPDYTQ